jgi:2-desacetyl-2-hydroxyethyl bacteriochlorophyllide A dehydrogenase
MRALVYSGDKKVEMQDLPRPTPVAGEVLVSVETAGICGSDISGFLGHSNRRRPPLVLGHELVGRLEDGRRIVVNPLISCQVCNRCLEGRRNLCARWSLLGMDRMQGAYAEFVSVPDRQVFAVSEELTTARAVLVEPLANIVHVYRLAGTPGLAALAIVGAGTMGTLALLLGKFLGFRKILVADVSDERLSLVSGLGAQWAVNVRTSEGADRARQTLTDGFDIVIDASGTSAARQLALDICAPGGQVILLGMAQQKSDIDFVTSIRKEHRVSMSFAYTPLDFARSLEILTQGYLDLDPWTTTLPLERGQEAFEKMSSTPGSTLKMLLQIGK